jgi:F-type H+-transporting ATPase subunit a
MLNPLEQFEIIPISIRFFNFFGQKLDFTVTNITLMMLVILVSVLFWAKITAQESYVIPRRFQFLFQSISQFIAELIVQQVGTVGLVFFRFFLFLFVFLLFANLLGLVPFCFTITSHIIAIFFIALTCNVLFVILGIQTMGLKPFLLHFIPQSAPRALIPLITLIEVVSYLMRTLSLSLRLFANMVAGHILLFILASFALKFSAMTEDYLSFLLYIPIVIILLVFVLELAICFIQAYVFLVLLTIYMAESVTISAH